MARVNLIRAAKVKVAQRKALPMVQTTTREVLVGARRLVKAGSHRSGSGVRRPGEPLKRSLGAKVKVTQSTVLGSVFSRKDYAATVHQGSKVHVIRPRSGGLLRFEWERGNLLLKHRGKTARRYFFFKKVRHPGNKRPVRYLTTPLQQFGKLNGFRVTTSPVSRSRLP